MKGNLRIVSGLNRFRSIGNASGFFGFRSTTLMILDNWIIWQLVGFGDVRREICIENLQVDIYFMLDVRKSLLKDSELLLK